MEPETLILRPRKTKPIKLTFISTLFVVCGIILINCEGFNTKNIIATSFFSIGIIVGLVQLIPGSTELKLDNKGFSTTSLFRKHYTKWSDVKYFKTDYLGPIRTVVYDYVDEHTKHRIGKLIAKNLSKYHAALPETYGVNPNELRRVMEKWQNNCEKQTTKSKKEN